MKPEHPVLELTALSLDSYKALKLEISLKKNAKETYLHITHIFTMFTWSIFPTSLCAICYYRKMSYLEINTLTQTRYLNYSQICWYRNGINTGLTNQKPEFNSSEVERKNKREK